MFRVVVLMLIAGLLWAQSGTPVLDPAYAFDTYVSGLAAPDAGPVVVYDVSYPARTKLGRATVDRNGKFAVSVKPRLNEGNRLVVEDRLKRISVSIVVQAPRPLPAPRRQ